VRPYLAALAAAALLGGCEETPVSSGGDSPCQTVLDYHGHRYVRHGELRRDATTTGRVDSGTMPACDDGNGAEPARQVQVAELADVSQRRAVLVEGTLYVRTDLPFPEVARICSCPRAAPLVGGSSWTMTGSASQGRPDPGSTGTCDRRTASACT